MSRRLVVLPTREAVEQRVAEELCSVIDAAIASRGRADIVITGGTVGTGTLVALREVSTRRGIDWPRVHVWWGDERFVAPGHDDRNERQAREAVFSHVDIPAANLHVFPADIGQTIEVARDAFLAENSGGFPHFDVVLNGIGPDGHVASLFAGRDHGDGEQVIAVTNSPKPPPQRLTFTFEVLNRCDHMWIVAAGDDKADAVERLMSNAPVSETPATGLRGTAETVVWVDASAAAKVTG